MTPEQAALIQAGAQVGTASINAIAQSNLNKKMREWNEKQYNLQRTHALQDWQMQQEYNSPTAQMKRLQDAGLNPNLIYGSGGATTQAQPVRGTEAKSWSPQAPQFQTPNIIGTYQDMQIRQAQTDLIKEQIATQKATQTEIASRNALRLIQGGATDFNTQQARRLADTQYQAAQQALRNMVVENAAKTAGIDLTRQQISEGKQTMDLQQRETEQRIANMILQGKQTIAQTGQTIAQTEQIKGLTANNKIQGQLLELQKNLQEQGIYPGDNIFMRMATQYLKNPKLLEKDIDNIKKIGNMIFGNQGPVYKGGMGPFGGF